MVEVFKTNVKDSDQAGMLMDQLHKNFPGYKVNFDLEDCDRILRVKSETGQIDSAVLINFLNDLGFYAEVLPDDLQIENPRWITGKISLKQEERTSLVQP